MVYRAVENENGIYRNNEGILFDILEAINVMTPQGKNVGWDTFNSIEEAAAAFGLIYIGEQDNDEIVDLLNAILSEEVNK